MKARLLQMSTVASLCKSQLRFLRLKTNQLEVAVASHSWPGTALLAVTKVPSTPTSELSGFFCRYPIAKLKATNILALVSTDCCFNILVRGAEK